METGGFSASAHGAHEESVNSVQRRVMCVRGASRLGHTLVDSITNLANHDINDDYDEDFFMLDTINASERSQSKDGYDDDKLGETDQRIGDYTRRHSLPSGYNLRPLMSAQGRMFFGTTTRMIVTTSSVRGVNLVDMSTMMMVLTNPCWGTFTTRMIVTTS